MKLFLSYIFIRGDWGWLSPPWPLPCFRPSIVHISGQSDLRCSKHSCHTSRPPSFRAIQSAIQFPYRCMYKSKDTVSRKTVLFCNIIAKQLYIPYSVPCIVYCHEYITLQRFSKTGIHLLDILFECKKHRHSNGNLCYFSSSFTL